MQKVNLYYCELPEGNFGDDLNRWLWPRLMPEIDLEADTDDVYFLGIGTLLNDYHLSQIPETARKIIFGTGAGLFRDGFASVTPDSTWDILAVRGPLTAEVLGVPADLAVTDPAALVARLEVPTIDPGAPAVYVPHLSNACPEWRKACEAADLRYVDPRDEVETVLATIAGSDLVLAEAMHAAIVADALRIPWIPVRSMGIDSFKWQDWCRSMELDYEPARLPPLWERPTEEPLHRKVYRNLKRWGVARRLSWLARRGERFLSADRVLRSRTEDLVLRLDRFRDAWSRGDVRT